MPVITVEAGKLNKEQKGQLTSLLNFLSKNLL